MSTEGKKTSESPNLLFVAANPGINGKKDSGMDFPFRYDYAETGSSALEKIRFSPYDAIVVNISLPDMDGITLLKNIKIKYPLFPVIIAGKDLSTETLLKLINLGTDYCIPSDNYGSVSSVDIDRAIKDIGPKITAHRRFHDASEYSKRLADSIPITIFIIDENGSFEFINNPGMAKLELEEEEYRGKSLLDLLLPYDREVIGKFMSNAMTDSENTFEVVLRTGKGGEFHSMISLHSTEIYGDGTCFLGSVIDLTDIQESEKVLKENEIRLNLALEGGDIGIWDWDLTTNEMVFNEKWVEMLGYSPEELTGHADEWWYMIHPDDFSDVIRDTQKYIDGKTQKFDIEYRIRKKDGGYIWVSNEAKAPEKDENSVPIRLTGIQRDITEIKYFRDSLEKANKKLKLLSSITRHDILNQITAMILNLAILGDQVTNEESLRYIDKCLSISKSIQNQINFTRDYESIGINSPEWQNVAGVVGQAQKGIRFDAIEVDPVLESIEIYADPLLEKVFFNLFDNAIRHGEGLTCIKISLSDGDDGEKSIIVRDDGPGVPDAIKKLIFGQGYGRNTGFGLFLTKEILDLTGITITENGKPGQGARFEMALPPGGWRSV